MAHIARKEKQHNTLELEEAPFEYVLRAHFDGVRAEDLALDVENDLLTIRGIKRLHHEHGGIERREESSVSFARSIQLPADVDTSRIQADFGDGTLEVHLPKTGAPANVFTSQEERWLEPDATGDDDEDAADRSWAPGTIGRSED